MVRKRKKKENLFRDCGNLEIKGLKFPKKEKKIWKNSFICTQTQDY